jgi:hypothetical protein
MAIKIEQSKGVEQDKGLDVSLSGKTPQNGGTGGGAQEAIRGAHLEKEALGAVRQQKLVSQQMQRKANEALELIANLEAAEKVEDAGRVKVAQDVQNRIETQTGQRTEGPTLLSPGRDDGSTGNKKQGVQGVQPPKVPAKVTLKGVGLKGAKVVGAVDPEKAKAQKRDIEKAIEKAEKVQRKAEEARKISEEEMLEKIDDKKELDQQKGGKQKGGILRARSLVATGEPSEEEGAEVREASASGNTGGLGITAAQSAEIAPQVAGVITASSGAVQGSQGEQRGGDAEQRRNDGVKVKDGSGDVAAQQTADALSAKTEQQELEEERKRVEIEAAMLAVADHVNLDVPNGFSANIAAELHQDVRDIRALLVMADAYDRLQDHIQGDVLAANVAAEGAASFAVTNVEAVQVASKRLKDQVGDVQAWQRFGML